MIPTTQQMLFDIFQCMTQDSVEGGMQLKVYPQSGSYSGKIPVEQDMFFKIWQGIKDDPSGGKVFNTN